MKPRKRILVEKPVDFTMLIREGGMKWEAWNGKESDAGEGLPESNDNP